MRSEWRGSEFAKKWKWLLARPKRPIDAFGVEWLVRILHHLCGVEGVADGADMLDKSKETLPVADAFNAAMMGIRSRGEADGLSRSSCRRHRRNWRAGHRCRGRADRGRRRLPRALHQLSGS